MISLWNAFEYKSVDSLMEVKGNFMLNNIFNIILSKLIDKSDKNKKIFCVIVIIICVFSMLKQGCLSMTFLLFILISLIILLENKIAIIYFYKNYVLIAVIVFTLLCEFLCYMVFNTFELINMITGYFVVEVFDAKDYFLINTHYLNNNYREYAEKNTIIGFSNSLRMTRVSNRFTYIVDKKETIEEQMQVFSEIIQDEIESYELFQENEYTLYLKDFGLLRIKVEYYSGFVVLIFL